MALLRAPSKSLFVATALCRTLLRSNGRRFAADSERQMSLIKLLRERTSAPIKEVKSALVDCGWDIEAAQKDLRKRGQVVASKKYARTAAEGLLALARDSRRAAAVELNCETDFVARNEIFQHLALALANRALLLDNSSTQASRSIHVGPEAFKGLKLNLEHPKFSGETTVENAIAEMAAIMGENVKLRRGCTISASHNDVLFSYLHTCPKPGLGRIAGILSLEVDNGNTEHNALQRVCSGLAMHVVASKPLFLTKELVASEALESEREILKSLAQSSGKPQMAIEKMVDGRLCKYMEEVVRMEQKFVVNDSLTVKTLLDNLSKEVGSSAKIENFFRMDLEKESKGTILKAGLNLSLKLCERSRPIPLVFNAVKDRFLNSVLFP